MRRTMGSDELKTILRAADSGGGVAPQKEGTM